jgi:hypothetical protein
MRYNLSEINELIRNRRTIFPEQFSERKVHREQIEVMLNNAQWAPTHGNTQPWRFHVFMEEGLSTLSQFLGSTYLKLTPEDQQNDTKLGKLIRRPLLSSVVIAVSMKRQPEEKISEIESDPQGEYSEEAIENRIDVMYRLYEGDPESYFNDHYGEYNAEVLERHGLIDIRDLIEEAVSTDGPTHFLSGYDGSSDLVFYEGDDYIIMRYS